MPLTRKTRTIALLAMILIAFVAECGGGSGDTPDTTTGLVVFSDIHFDPFDDESLFNSLVAADASQWAGIFASSSSTDPSTWGSDTNYPLFARSLAAIGERQQAASVAIFTGDILRHDFASTFYELSGTEDEEEMQAFANKTVAFFVSQVRASLGATPVLFCLGNNDAYADYDIEPNGAFLANTAEVFYADFIGSAAESDAFLATYRAGGYYSAAPLGAGLRVIALNTVLFSKNAVGNVTAAAEEELGWFENELATASAAGERVWILLHVPPGINIHSTRSRVSSDGHISSASLFWEPEYQAQFLASLDAHADIIDWMLGGHTHMDEYRLPVEALDITPAISPIDGNDPGFRVFSIPAGSFAPTDYAAYTYSLSLLPASFSKYYTFSTAYALSGDLSALLAQLDPLLVSDPGRQGTYRDNYYSGHDAANLITDLNWPVSWCGIAEMTEQAMIDCVNGY